ncbi:MAG: hypothetical protein ACKOSS_12165 [Planctomycetia bacterium]
MNSLTTPACPERALLERACLDRAGPSSRRPAACGAMGAPARARIAILLLALACAAPLCAEPPEPAPAPAAAPAPAPAPAAALPAAKAPGPAPAATPGAANAPGSAPRPAALVVAGGTQGLRPRGAALASALRSTRLARVELDEVELPRLLEWLRTATGWNWALDRKALAEAGLDPALVRVSAHFEDLAVATLLEVVLEPHGLALRVHDTLVWVTTKAAAEGPLLTRLYGITHLTWTKVDFPGPRISLQPDGAGAEVVPAEELVEDDGLATGEQVVEMVQRLVEPGRWGSDGWEMRATQRDLVVRAPAAVHARVLRALAMLQAVK